MGRRGTGNAAKYEERDGTVNEMGLWIIKKGHGISAKRVRDETSDRIWHVGRNMGLDVGQDGTPDKEERN